ncbi:MAG: universal stress protein [Bacteroidetes bacterium]|nr:universal stress protein [Bacteroidota bacterium]
MRQYFNSILIPVDFSENTELAVKKGLELAGNDAVIHLLHVQNHFAPFFSRVAQEYLIGLNRKRGMEEIDKKLEQWKRTIEETSSLKVCTWNVIAGSVQDIINHKATQLKVDLIIIAKHSSHSWFPILNTVNPSQLVQSTGIPVLTAKTGSFHNKARKIVVPVSSRSAYDKMEIITALSKKFRLHIYIAAIVDNHKEPLGFYASSILELCKWVKTTIGCPVEYTMLRGSNKAKAILDYAEKINADILLLYPETETKLGWMNSEISDVLPSSTKVEVLTIWPLAV